MTFSAENNISLLEILNQSIQAMAVFVGPQLELQVANTAMLKLWEKDSNVLGKFCNQTNLGITDHLNIDLLQQAWQSGNTIQSINKASALANQIETVSYYNYLYQPITNKDGALHAILYTAVETSKLLVEPLIDGKQEHAVKSNVNDKVVESNLNAVQANDAFNKSTQLKANERAEYNDPAKPENEASLSQRSALEESLRKSEQRLQGILETMAEGVGIIDATGKMVYANPMAQQILGITLSEIEDRTYDDPRWQNLRIDGSPLPHDEHPMAMMMATGKPVFDAEISVQPLDRERFYISINAAPIFNEDGVLTGGIGTFMDVTARRMIVQGKDDFISIASHELKTPVTALKISLQLLERAHERLTAEARGKLISQSIRSLDQLSKLLDDLLDTTRMEKGQISLDKHSFPIHALLVESCKQAVGSAIQKIIIEEDTGRMVWGDEQRIGQVVINFLTNAIKYAPLSKQVIIRTSLLESDEIKVSIIDEGPGIPPEKLEHLFERYYRTDYSGQKFTGLGLGLYICAEIVKNHGGRIGANSELGKGSEFWFTLPLKQD